MCKEGTGTGTGSVIGGKGALDKINTEGWEGIGGSVGMGVMWRMKRIHRKITAGARALKMLETADSMASANFDLTCARSLIVFLTGVTCFAAGPLTAMCPKIAFHIIVH